MEINQTSVITEQPTTSQTVLTHNLAKKYGQFTAVNHINLEIEQGAIFGFIGPNGAGKTTTMRMLATLLEPTEGEAWICGYPLSNRSIENLGNIRAAIGFMPDFIGIYERMTAREYLDFYAAAYRIETKRRPQLIKDLLDLVDLSSKRDTFIDGLSRGMTQRLALARTLIHDPRLLILDEPASGLDPRARVELRELLKELSRMGKTIIISSHILTELTEMCSHIGIIEQGTLLTSGRVADIMRSLKQHKRHVLLKIKPLAAQYSEKLKTVLEKAPGVVALKTLDAPDSWELQVDGDEQTLNLILRYLVHHNIPFYSFSEQDVNLEDIFFQVTKGYVS